MAAEILAALKSGRDLYLFDRFIAGPDRLECARKVLIERRDARSDPDEAAFLSSVIRGLEKGGDGDGEGWSGQLPIRLSRPPLTPVSQNCSYDVTSRRCTTSRSRLRAPWNPNKWPWEDLRIAIRLNG